MKHNELYKKLCLVSCFTFPLVYLRIVALQYFALYSILNIKMTRRNVYKRVLSRLLTHSRVTAEKDSNVSKYLTSLGSTIILTK